jgi:hypothetical protein
LEDSVIKLKVEELKIDNKPIEKPEDPYKELRQHHKTLYDQKDKQEVIKV